LKLERYGQRCLGFDGLSVPLARVEGQLPDNTLSGAVEAFETTALRRLGVSSLSRREADG
jgi:hypothetical protein